MFGAAFGVGLGLSAGWLVFGVHQGADPVAAEGPVAPSAADGPAGKKPSTAREETSAAVSADPAGEDGAASNGARTRKAGAGWSSAASDTSVQAPQLGSQANTPSPTASGAPVTGAPTGVGGAAPPAVAGKATAASTAATQPAKRNFRSIDRPSGGPRHAAPPASRAALPANGPPVQSPQSSLARKRTPALSTPASAPERSGPSAPAPSRAVDKLLDEALSSSTDSSVLARADAAREVPMTPTKDDLVTAVKVLLPAVRACAMGQKGVATVSLVVANSGRVQLARVLDAPFAGTAAGRCIEGVARKARLPKFQKPIFKVRIPLSLQ